MPLASHTKVVFLNNKKQMKTEHLKSLFCLEMRSNETVFDHISKHRGES